MKKAHSYSSQHISSPIRILAGFVLVAICISFGFITLRNIFHGPPNIETAPVVETTKVPAKIIEQNGRRYMIIELGEFGKKPEPKPVDQAEANEMTEQPQ